MDNRILLYHTGYQQIQNPDVHFGRTNADFGQGFYTTKDPEFAKRWARERKGSDTIINTYELGLSGLSDSKQISGTSHSQIFTGYFKPVI